ncbi:MAG: AraC family transcriptional regulator [Capsulimonadaceae bacterium]|nr:AraC family transcriptional regulator [Capsulimonadaceae bacterium]
MMTTRATSIADSRHDPERLRKSALSDGQKPAADSLIMPAFSGYRYSIVDEAATYAEHVHADHEVIYVDVGRYQCAINGVDLDVEPGHVVVVKPQDRHADSFTPPLRCIAISFRLQHPAAPDRGQSLFADNIRPDEQVASMRRDDVLPLVARMRAEARIDDDVSSMIGDALLREFFWRMVRAFGPDVISPAFLRSSAEQGWRLKLRQLLRSHRDAFASVAEMAATLGVSERTLNKRCQEILNESPSQALMNYKLDEALAMVTQTEMTVQQISHTLGFTNPYHFSKAFKRRFGASPLNRRNQA